MKTKEIKVSLEATINTGNYENMKPAAEVTLLVEDGDNVNDVWKEGWEIVTEQVKSAWLKVKQAN